MHRFLLVLSGLALSAANQVQVIIHPSPVTKIGERVDLSCNFADRKVAFGDSVQWTWASHGKESLIADNLLVSDSWKSLVNVSLDNILSILHMTVETTNQTGTYICSVKQLNCARGCQPPTDSVFVTVHGPVTSIEWQNVADGKIMANVEQVQVLGFSVVALEDVTGFIRVMLDGTDITNDFQISCEAQPDKKRFVTTGSADYEFSENNSQLKLEVSVPLHSQVVEVASVVVRVPPRVDCPEDVPVEMDKPGVISCSVHSTVPLTLLIWASDNGFEMMANASESSEGLKSDYSDVVTENGYYNVHLRSENILESQLRKYTLYAANIVGRRNDAASFVEVVHPPKSTSAIPSVKEKLSSSRGSFVRTTTSTVAGLIVVCLLALH